MPAGVPWQMHCMDCQPAQIPMRSVVVALSLRTGLPVKITLNLLPQLGQYIRLIPIMASESRPTAGCGKVSLMHMNCGVLQPRQPNDVILMDMAENGEIDGFEPLAETSGELSRDPRRIENRAGIPALQ